MRLGVGRRVATAWVLGALRLLYRHLKAASFLPWPAVASCAHVEYGWCSAGTGRCCCWVHAFLEAACSPAVCSRRPFLS